MIKIISGLIKKGFAYEKNGNVFFDIEKFPEYGKLSGNTLENLKIGARLEEHPDKKNPWDFALWLKAPEKHLMQWKSPWSVGYPGWHIECSAMSTEYLGETIDIHTGGEDNIFPHHEAEIAQTQCYTGKKFVNYWIHVRHLLVDGEKMAKSKGNFYTLVDIKEKGFEPMILRLLLLSSHYRSNLNFTWDGMNQAKSNLQKISDFVLNMEIMAAQNLDIEISEKIPVAEFEKRFEEAMNDDLNTPLALSVLFDLISTTNKITSQQRIPSKKAKQILSLWKKINSVFGLKLNGQAEIPEEILMLAKNRENARKEKDFQKADDFRKNIEEKGYSVEDTSEGFKVKKN
jgi:cysteinyl-tRNA synthetase